MKSLTLPSSSLGQVSWAGTSLEDHFLERGGNESWNSWIWWMMWNVLQQDTETWRRKGFEASKLIYPLDYFVLVSSLSFSVPINLKLETCHIWWQKNRSSCVTVFTSLKVRTLAWRIQISVKGRNWTTIIHMLHTFKPLYWKKYERV